MRVNSMNPDQTAQHNMQTNQLSVRRRDYTFNPNGIAHYF